jgi:hypothetical protein
MRGAGYGVGGKYGVSGKCGVYNLISSPTSTVVNENYFTKCKHFGAIYA